MCCSFCEGYIFFGGGRQRKAEHGMMEQGIGQKRKERMGRESKKET